MSSKQTDENLIRKFAETRDPALREEAVLSFLPLVYYVIGRLGFTANSEMDRDDLISQGVVGLIEAVDHYDLRYGTKFSTYAVPKIRGKILDHLRNRDWLPRQARQLTKQVQEAVRVLHQRLKRSPTEQEIAGYLGLEVEQVQQALTHASHVVVSLDSLVPWLEGENSLVEDSLADDSQSTPSQVYREKALQGWLKSAVLSLEEREQLLLSLYYYEELTMREIGEVLGISESRVCQLHARALLSLRAVLEEYLDEDTQTEAASREVVEHV
jgi:RNA polymerase sigma factor for flagellar operon FliA